MSKQSIVCMQTTQSFSLLLSQSAQKLSGSVEWVADIGAWADALDRYFPSLALLEIDRRATIPLTEDPNYTEEWQLMLRRVKLRPHTKYIPVVAFSRHDEEGLHAAKELGADEVWRLNRLEPALSALIERYLDPPVRYPMGWDQPLPKLAQAGLQHFNRGDYFEQHELLEEAWRAEERPIRDLYQGILQIGVAFYQIELGNWKGAIKTFRRALPKLRDLPPVCQGINLAEFRKVAEEIHADITSLGPENLEQFDQKRFPRIKYKA